MNSTVRELILVLFTVHLRDRSEPVWVGSLVRLLESVGASEGAVRTALSRMASDGLVDSTRRGRHALYRLTSDGRRLHPQDERRTYRKAWKEPWDGTWTIAQYSIPEERRGERERIRRELRRLGYGPLGGGVWLSPHPGVDRLTDLLRAEGWGDDVRLFRGEYRGMGGTEELLRECWNLEQLNAEYEAFINRWLDRYRSCERRQESGALPSEAAFRLHLRVHAEFRAFPLADPVLPPTLQPETWGGECAEGLFEALDELLEASAREFVVGTVEQKR